jgi:DNA-binding NtrC family response regulator
VTALRTLILHKDRCLAEIWAGFLRREGLEPLLAPSAVEAFEALRAWHFHALILDIEAPDALSVADFAAYRCPGLPVIPVSARTFLSGSAIFEIMPNACSILSEAVDPADMAAVAGHYARRYDARASTA